MPLAQVNATVLPGVQFQIDHQSQVQHKVYFRCDFNEIVRELAELVRDLCGVPRRYQAAPGARIAAAAPLSALQAPAQAFLKLDGPRNSAPLLPELDFLSEYDPTPAQHAAIAALAADAHDAALPVTMLVVDIDAARQITQTQFASLAAACAAILREDPSTFYQTLSVIGDKSLSGALHYTVQNTIAYHARSLRANGADKQRELATLAPLMLFERVAQRAFRGWAPRAGVTQVDLQAAREQLGRAHNNCGGKHDIDNLINNHHVAPYLNEHTFSDCARAFTDLYVASPSRFYAALSAVLNSTMREMLNYAAMDFMSNRFDRCGDTGQIDAGFKGVYRVNYGKVGHQPHTRAEDILDFPQFTLQVAGPTGNFKMLPLAR